MLSRFSLGCSRNIYSNLTCAIIIVKTAVCYTVIYDNLMGKVRYNHTVV